MGLIASLASLLRGGGVQPRPISWEPGEIEVTRLVSAALHGGIAWVGGDLVLTDRRLLFTPLNLADVNALLQWGLRLTGDPTGGVTEVATLTAVAGVEQVRDASLSFPSALSVRLTNGSTFEFGAFKTRMTATGAAVNNEVRDRFLAAVVSAGGGASPG